MNQSKIKILLADDDEDDRYFFNDALKQLNISAELISFTNGEDLIGYFKEDNSAPDFIFLDINMPKTNGIECLKLLKQINSEHPPLVIMLSTASEKTVIELTRTNGASAYIEKPNHLKELIKCLSFCFHDLKNAPSDLFLINSATKLIMP